jgi:RND family efflux transporter MFP subunit
MGLTLAGCSGQPVAEQSVEAASTQPLEVTAAAVELREVDRVIDVTGALAPDEKVSVTAEVAGRIAELPFDFGQSVRKGQLVARLDDRELRLQVDRSRAALGQALARLGLDPKAANIEPPTTTPAVRQSEAQMQDALLKYENAKKLLETGDVARERFEELEKQLHARDAALEAVRDEVRTQWANVEALRADMALAEERLSDATVYAPFDGAISERHVSPGEYIKDNTPIVTIVKSHPMRLNADIPEVAAGVVHIGTRLEFTSEAAPGKIFTAIVREINPSLDSASRSLSAQARLTTTDAVLRPGMFVQVQLKMAQSAPVVMAPQEALLTIAGLTKMFAVRDGKAVELRVKAGAIRDGWVEVTGSGVEAGEQVITSSLPELVTGAPVTVSNQG